MYGTDILYMLKHIEREITKVEKELKCLEAKGTLHKINDHMRRRLKKCLNGLYRARMFVAEKLSLVVAEEPLTKLKYLQAFFRRYASEFNAPVEIQLLKHPTMLAFLVSVPVLQMVKKENCPKIYDKEKAKRLCDGLHFVVPPNAIIVCPASVKFKKRPMKENKHQIEVRASCSYIVKFDLCLNVQNTGSTSATGTTHNASGMLVLI